MKRLIFFCASLGKGGAERVISVLSAELAAMGKSVGILTYYSGEAVYSIDSRVPVISVEGATKSRNILRNLLWMRHYFRDNALLICSFISSFNMLAVATTRGMGIPVIVSERTDPTRKCCAYRWARNFLYGYADAIVAQTEISRVYFASRTNTKCVTIYNPLSPKLKIGNALSAKKEPVIVSVGRLVPVKNQAMLLRAFKKVKEKYPQYKLVVYGEGECRETLENLREALGLNASAEFAGEVQDIFERISSAEVFVLSSDFEGMPNALLEAMCLGVPVVSTKVSGAVEVIKNEENGLLVDVGDETGMAAAIEKLLGDENMRGALAKRAICLAEKLKISFIMSEWSTLLETIA